MPGTKKDLSVDDAKKEAKAAINANATKVEVAKQADGKYTVTTT
jgi:hypothetical protein